jgi:N4-gp56 family major capsid protein
MMTTSRHEHPVNIVFQQMFLAYTLGKMPHSQFGKKVTMPEHAGDTVKWRRLSEPQAQTTALQEDVDPSPIMPSKTDLEAQVREYGARTRVTGWLKLTGLNQTATELTKWLADTFRLTIDTLDREMLATTASTLTCSNGSATSTDLNATDLDIGVQTLLGQDAEPITDMMGAATGQGTAPLMPSYVGIISTALYRTLKAVAGYREVKNYAEPSDRLDGEIGATDFIRWIMTSRGYVSSSNYYLPIIGQGAYGNVRIPGGDKLTGYKPPETAGSEMNRYSVYFWLANYVSRILDDSKILTVICTAIS